MLVSEHAERGRKFKLAIRAGLPVLALIGLVAYSTFFQNEDITIGLREVILGLALVFVTTYFIFFLLEEDGQKSLIDPITNSYNYPAFLQSCERRRPRTLGMLLINNLGTINENYGTEEIDAMLRSLIYQLDGVLNATGLNDAIIGRKQGAAFLVALDTDPEQLTEALESFVRDHATIRNIELDYRFAVLPVTGGDYDKIVLHLYDTIQAQHLAKGNAPDNDKVLSSAPPANGNGTLEDRIVEAIHSGKVTFSLRPLYHIRTQRITTYEVGVKLPIPGEAPLLPRVYLPIINRLGLGRDYDLVILKHVLDLLQLIDPEISFSFNLSPFSLRNSEFQEKAFERIEASGVRPDRLIIELYERKTHHNLEGYLKTLGSFRAKGLRICIDNFGSSNASMEYMRHFKFDMVQFDRDFVGKLDDKASRAMLESLIRMSHELEIETVAKWVDKPEQKQILENMGVDYLQGFIVARPLSEEQLIQTYNA